MNSSAEGMFIVHPSSFIIRFSVPHPAPASGAERVNVRVAQLLHLPIDVKLLVGREVAHAESSPFLLDTLEPNRTSRKYIGGLVLHF